MFRDGAKFPQAQTMLEATAEANNRNARAKALESYCAAMDAKVGTGPDVRYLEAKELRLACRAARDDALLAFDTMATMGRKSAIDEFRASLDEEIGKSKERFRLMNEARNPFKNAESLAVCRILGAPRRGRPRRFYVMARRAEARGTRQLAAAQHRR